MAVRLPKLCRNPISAHTYPYQIHTAAAPTGLHGAVSRMTARYRATLRGPAESAGTCRIATGAPEGRSSQDDSATRLLSPVAFISASATRFTFK